jgi:fused signal recognition particle receptor
MSNLSGEKFYKGLFKTRTTLWGKMGDLLGRRKSIDLKTLEELEAIFLKADVGIKTTQKIINSLEPRFRKSPPKNFEELLDWLKESLLIILGESVPLNLTPEKPWIFLVVGVNGSGKTTTIAKLAYRFQQEGKKVLLAAGDTFRAAAIDQLEVWGRRLGVDVIRHQPGADPAAVIYDAMQAARARNIDLLLVDTAGRLHTRVNLMEELKKIKRIINREFFFAPQEVLLVLDAITGQNAFSQARLFKEVVNVTGIILAKLDGTARGGMVIAIKEELNIPVKLIGVGEELGDLEEFDSRKFVEAILEAEVQLSSHH